MSMLPVLSKIGTIFEYVYDERGRPTGQTIDKLVEELNVDNINNIKVTAKMDGTCCYIKDGKIYARQDVKDILKAPEEWFPTAGIEKDKGGHIIGFRPLDTKKGDKWHLMAIERNDEGDRARFLEFNNNTKKFYYTMRNIDEFNGKTCELVGPHVNGNKHQLTNHAYIIHGSVEVDAEWKTHGDIQGWFDDEGVIYEGIVIHNFNNNNLYKCHRGHLGGSFIWEGYKLPVEE
jgi:hypothetical protein